MNGRQSEKPPAIREIFLQALELPGAERDGFLQEVCAGDASLRSRVEALLKNWQEDSFLEMPAVEPGPTLVVAPKVSEGPGTVIDKYKLLEKLGEGGFGVVYMAEQKQPVKRRVALKIIKVGMDTREVVARFEAERQALALMDHPCIAKVLDGGATETGRPYFVMELVRGTRITDYCDEKNLSTRERLDLFMQACQAVQHAHQKGIIHRDLKPSNILVTVNDGVPIPKVIDFGIAKATQMELTEKTVFTRFQQFIGTPAYMSPEQAEITSVDVDTRSDIYSLGVLLYELLTGKTPFEAKELLEAGLDEMRRTLREKEPARPSTRVSTFGGDELTTTAKRRGIEAPKLVNVLRGDLDWIVMKCLEKDRARRYETANGLASDIQRHLNNEPVFASPPSNLYKFQKLVRRNKLAFVAGTGIAAALVIGLAIALWQSIEKTRAYGRAVAAEQEAKSARATEAQARRQAEEARTRAEANEKKAQTGAAQSRQVAQFLGEIFHGLAPTVALGRDTTLLKGILDKAAQRISTELTNQPEVEIELRSNLAESYNELGLFKEEAKMARQCLELARAHFPAESPQVAEGLFQMALALNSLGQLKEAEAAARESVSIRRKLFAAAQVSTNLSSDSLYLTERFAPWSLCDSLSELGHVLYIQSEYDKAETAYREALTLARQFRGNKHRDVAVQLSGLGIVLGEAAKLGEAEEALHESLEIFRALSSGQPNPAVANSLNNLALVLRREGRFDEAERLLVESLEITRKMVGPEHLQVASGLHNLATVAHDWNRLAEAETREREAIAMLRRLGNDELFLATALGRLGNILTDKGELDEAQQVITESLATRRRLLGEENVDVATSLVSLGNILQRRGKSAEAEDIFRQAVATRRKLLGNAHPDVAASLRSLGGLLSNRGNLEEAETVLRESLAIMRRLPVSDNSRLATVLNDLALLLRDLRKLDEAEPMFREALALQRKLSTNESPAIILGLNNLGLLLIDKARVEEAETLFREALALARKFSGDESVDFAWTLLNLSSALRRERKYGEAEEYCRQAVSIRKKLLSPTDPDVASALSALAAVLRDAGKPVEAETFFRQALEIRRKVFGDDSPIVATTLYNLAGVLETQDKLPDAEICYAEALAIRRKHLSNDHPDLADSLVALGRLLCRLDHWAEAEPLFKEALVIREKRLPDDWRTFNTQSLLGGSLLSQKKYADAEPLLLRGYEGMKQRDEKIPADAKIRIQEALQRLVQLYDETSRAQQAVEWKAKLTALDREMSKEPIEPTKLSPK
jgi:serine/threonine protein kinase/tetratricopeptide (TPR) repeat protein